MPLVALGRHLADRVLPAAGWGLVAGLVGFGLLLPWLIPFGYVAFGLLVVVQAAFVGAYVALLAWHGDRRGRAVLAVAAWVALEAVRARWPLGGFGWGSLAATQAGGGAGGLALGLARTLGAHGVDAALATTAVAVEAAIAAGTRSWAQARAAAVPADAVFTAMRTPLLALLGTLTATVLLAGAPPAATGRTVDVGIVQAGDTRATAAAGATRQDSDRIVAVTQLMLDSTRPFAADPPDVVIWPENSLDTDVRDPDGSAARERLEAALALVEPAPILGGEIADGPRPGTLYNQMTVFTTEGIGASYTKRQPVPFGEYVPARAALDWFPPLQQIPADVLPGGAAQVLEVAGARIGTVICFENAFPRLAREQVLAGADVLVVSTNNSSFGDTPMSAQHLAQSRLRAVETGRWVVHAGISGISAFVDPEGGLHEVTPLFEQGAPRMAVPLVEGMTPAVRVGSGVAWLAVAAAVAAAAAGRYPFLAYRRL